MKCMQSLCDYDEGVCDLDVIMMKVYVTSAWTDAEDKLIRSVELEQIHTPQ